MFLDVKELAVRKIRIRKSYAPGRWITIPAISGRWSLSRCARRPNSIEGQIRVTGELHTRLEMVCARCLEPVNEDVSREFDLFTGRWPP
jgi:hypothetical protein